jgi:hypothetical protein
LLISPFAAEESSKKRKVELECDICFEVFHEQQKFDAHRHAPLGKCIFVLYSLCELFPA